MDLLPFSQLPGMNSLFIDFVENPEKVKDLYPLQPTIEPRDLPHRKNLCALLQRQNAVFENPHAAALLEKLNRTDTLCVITGQQTGLLTGPLYTLWKALTALRAAQQAEKETGFPCVPIFWMAGEDHNIHEIANFALLKPDFEIQNFSLKEHFFLNRQPTGSVSVGNPEIRKILLRALSEIKAPRLKEYYSSGTLAQAFAKTLLWLLENFPILIVDPSDPELKRLAVPFFAKFFERKHRMMELLREQNERLKARHYPVQVKMEENTLPLFLIQNGERSHMTLDTPTVAIAPEALSPSALLRPLFQDFLFPTLAYVGGPAEIAYFAQLHPWYQAMDLKQPRLLSRASVTLLPAATKTFLDSKKLKPEEFFIREDILLDALLNSRSLNSIRAEIRQLNETVSQGLDKIKNIAEEIEPTLRKSIETSERKVRYQIQKMEKKAFFAAKRKDQILFQQVRSAKNVIYPDEKLQERHINIFSFASRLPELVNEVYEKIELPAKGHQWIEI